MREFSGVNQEVVRFAHFSTARAGSHAPKVLPADVYDALELSALVFGGIGAGPVWDWDTPRDEAGHLRPNCVHGHGLAICNAEWFPGNEPTEQLDRAGIDFHTSDGAVVKINERRGRTRQARVTFREYTRELNIVRGE